MTTYNQLLSALLLIDSSLDRCYVLRQAGKSICTDLYESLVAATCLAPHREPVYLSALSKCTLHIIACTARFEEQFLSPYMVCRDALQKAMHFVKEWGDAPHTPHAPHAPQKMDKQSKREVILRQLVCLAGKAYEDCARQIGYVESEWRECSKDLSSGKVIMSQEQQERVRLLVLHIDYETYIDPRIQQEWKDKLIALKSV